MIELHDLAVAAIHERLDTQLAAFITQVNDEVTDGILCDAPQQILPYVPPVSYLTAFPTFGVMDGPFTLEDDTGWGATGRGTITVIAFEQNADQAILAWRLRRYAKAVARCVLDGRTIHSSNAWGVTLKRIDPGPTLAQESPQSFRSMTAVTVEVRSEQDTA